MFTVYVLYSTGYDKIYVGFTSNIQVRINSHNHPKNKGWTAKYRPWQLIYSESSQTKSEAMVREKQLKSARGRLFIKSLLEEYRKS